MLWRYFIPILSACLLLVPVFMPWACKPVRPTQSKEEAIQLVKTRLGTNYQTHPNPTGEYILYLQDHSETQPLRDVKYLVLEVKTMSVVMEQSLIRGHVKWSGEYTLEILSLPGTIRDDDDPANHVQHIDVHTLRPLR